MPIKTRKVLVVGGAGYIGSHMVLALQAANFVPIVLDNLSNGHAHAVQGAELIVGHLDDVDLLRQVFSQHQITCVMHFASLINVAESVRKPALYYRNNVASVLTLLDTMREFACDKFIFSSSAAVYGEPTYTPIDESHPLRPINPYGRSKWMIEEILQDYAKSDGLRFAILRYFNAAGADPLMRLGECHQEESHLIPLILQVAKGAKAHLTIYGDNYPTKDGTCVRDYVHVQDVCAAHLLTLQALIDQGPNMLYNVGTGRGFSVQEVVDVARRITLNRITTKISPARAGDVAILMANADKLRKELAWEPKFIDLDTIIKHAWQFIQKST